jgi:hypothetical protein
MRFLCTLLLAGFLLSLAAEPASAILPFYKVWKEEYLDNHPDQEFAKMVNKPANRCFVCHVGKKRSHRNEYGAVMEADLDWKKDAKDKEKILAAIKKASEAHVDPNDASSETFADRIAASKFPGGELEEMKKEPAE